jgi:NAD(P)-dependent dehydrogenase (short-subunit alcohol dehydrogenase family)
MTQAEIGLRMGFSKDSVRKAVSRLLNLKAEYDPRLSTVLAFVNAIKVRRGVPLGRWQEPEDVAVMAVFLASARAANVTGQTINVDGGYVMH